jgi:hypothetical protein
MSIAAIFSILFFGALPLGDAGNDVTRVDSKVEANNVNLGDPMTLTVSFYGEGDFSNLHPPKLSRLLDSKVWKVDDESARTDTSKDGRRIIYRVRPVKEGLLTFPALEFENSKGDKFSTTAFPVNVRPGSQAALSGLDDDLKSLQKPDGIRIALAHKVNEDELFRWKKACRNPTSAAFSKFDFPEARLNEAACRTMEGDWAKALDIYSSLEWRIGQTPEIERGMIAALSAKLGSGNAELPVWRIVLRPILKFDWRGRLGFGVGAILLAAVLLFVFGRIAKAFAGIAVLLSFIPMQASAFFGESMPDVNVVLTVEAEKSEVEIGEKFDIVFKVEAPKSSSLENLRFSSPQAFGLATAGDMVPMTDAKAENPENVVKRFSVPVRYNVPYDGDVEFSVRGQVSSSRSENGRGRSSFFSFSRSFLSSAKLKKLKVKFPPSEKTPKEFKGACGEAFVYYEKLSMNKVSTNDVVVVDCVLTYQGNVPDAAVPQNAFRGRGRIYWRKYVVADGKTVIPGGKIHYYNSSKRDFDVVSSTDHFLKYVSRGESYKQTVAVDAQKGEKPSEFVELKFYPGGSAPVIAHISISGDIAVMENYGQWVRIDNGEKAGWVRKDEFENARKRISKK